MSEFHDSVVDTRDAMRNLRTYQFGADAEVLTRACESGAPPAHLEPAFRVMVTEIVSRVHEKPISIYLCSPDENRDARNKFGFVLARLLREHLSTALLVDCDFLAAGLGGIVPHRDALGFLDLLLYGVSLGAIAQEAAHGVKVVGAGSFAVSKKGPFVADAFVDARRYLVGQAKCVVFVGPSTDDEKNLHPIAENVDLVVLARMGDRFDSRFLDPLEERISAVQGVEAWSVQIDTAAAVPGEEKPRVAATAEPTLVAGVEELVKRTEEKTPPAALGKERRTREKPPPEKAPPARGAPPLESSGPMFEEEGLAPPRLRKGGAGSRMVRVVSGVVGVVLVVFVVWWLYLTRSIRERDGERVDTAGRPSVAVEPSGSVEGRDSLAGEPAVSPGQRVSPDARAVVGRESGGEVRRDDAGGTAVEAPAERPAQVVGSTPESIFTPRTLDQFANQYLIHVSSFRTIGKAQEEAFYLLGWGFPVFIYRVDLGSKGMWHRVYVGPFSSRDEAMKTKIKLDENPRIQSTRVSKVPG